MILSEYNTNVIIELRPTPFRPLNSNTSYWYYQLKQNWRKRNINDWHFNWVKNIIRQIRLFQPKK